MEKLKAWMDLTERTPRQLAGEIGASHNSVLNWLAGRNIPGGLMIRRLHVVSQIPLEHIVPQERAKRRKPTT